MAQALRAGLLSLRRVPSLQALGSFHCILPPQSATAAAAASAQRLFFATSPPPRRSRNLKSRGLRRPVNSAEDGEGGGDTSDGESSDAQKSRNDKKREARRAVRWGMELASFSTPQIKRILSVASLEPEVFEALMLVKRLGPDVREGKRRQFNYIGKLLRDADPELLGALIQATKDSDHSMIEALSRARGVQEDISEAESESESECDTDDEDLESEESVALANKWFDGLVNQDIQISNEVYSLGDVEYDRQELRKLVRRVHSVQKRISTAEVTEEQVMTELRKAKISLARFLRLLAKQMMLDAQHYAALHK